MSFDSLGGGMVCSFCGGDGKCAECGGTGINPHLNKTSRSAGIAPGRADVRAAKERVASKGVRKRFWIWDSINYETHDP